jgi:hypothetical protein
MFFAMQNQETESLGDNYYLGGHEKGRKIGGSHDVHIVYDAYRNGRFKMFSKDDLSAKHHRFCTRHSGGEEQFARTLTMNQAFAGIVLGKCDFPGRDPMDHTCKVYRGMTRESLRQSNHGYDQTKTGDIVTIKHSITESSSIVETFPYFNGMGTDTHEMNLPFARARIIYPPRLRMQAALEFVGDYSGIPGTIKQN